MAALKPTACTFAALLMAGAALVLPGAARAASFDCTNARTAVEKAICGNTNLSNLDEYLGRYYDAARLALGDGGTCLRDDQRHWISATRNLCGSNVACLTNAYLKRLATLDGLQPGVTQIRNLTLPREPTLAVAIPPETEAPHSGNGGVLAIRGHLAWEQKDINNMGYAVRSNDGRAHVIVFDMDIGNSKTHAVLRGLIERNTTATFLVRGNKDKNGGFAMDRCRFIYRLPGQT
jgi:uncharacterized protein